MLDAVPAATLPIYPGLGHAQEYAGLHSSVAVVVVVVVVVLVVVAELYLCSMPHIINLVYTVTCLSYGTAVYST